MSYYLQFYSSMWKNYTDIFSAQECVLLLTVNKIYLDLLYCLDIIIFIEVEWNRSVN